MRPPPKSGQSQLTRSKRVSTTRGRWSRGRSLPASLSSSRRNAFSTISRRPRLDAWPWRFDPDRAMAPIEICQQLPNIKGPLADRPIRLMAWQLCWTANLFGFVERETGWRRFRQASIWVPRGNGKSTWLAPLAINCAFCEGEGGAEAYAAAVTRDQSKIVWSTAAEMLRRAPDLRHYLGIEQSAHSLYKPQSASSFLPLSSDAKSLDGLNVHFACLDEDR